MTLTNLTQRIQVDKGCPTRPNGVHGQKLVLVWQMAKFMRVPPINE
jgi:hypothetical protein